MNNLFFRFKICRTSISIEISALLVGLFMTFYVYSCQAQNVPINFKQNQSNIITELDSVPNLEDRQSDKKLLTNIFSVPDSVPFRLLSLEKQNKLWSKNPRTLGGYLMKYVYPGIYEGSLNNDSIKLIAYSDFNKKRRYTLAFQKRRPFYSVTEIRTYLDDKLLTKIDLLQRIKELFASQVPEMGFMDAEFYKNIDCQKSEINPSHYYAVVEVEAAANNYMLVHNRIFDCFENKILKMREVLEIYNDSGERVNTLNLMYEAVHSVLSYDGAYIVISSGGSTSLDPQTVCSPMFHIFDLKTNRAVFENEFKNSTRSAMVIEAEKDNFIVVQNQNKTGGKEFNFISLENRTILSKSFSAPAFDKASRSFTGYLNFPDLDSAKILKY